MLNLTLDTGWNIFVFWAIALCGALWVRRVSNTLRCNLFTASIFAAVFTVIQLGVFTGFLYLYHMESWLESMAVQAVLFFGLVGFFVFPMLSMLLCHALLPGFKVQKSKLIPASFYLFVWMFVGLTLYNILSLLVVALALGGSQTIGSTHRYRNHGSESSYYLY